MKSNLNTQIKMEIQLIFSFALGLLFMSLINLFYKKQNHTWLICEVIEGKWKDENTGHSTVVHSIYRNQDGEYKIISEGMYAKDNSSYARAKMRLCEISKNDLYRDLFDNKLVFSRTELIDVINDILQNYKNLSASDLVNLILKHNERSK